MPFPRRFFALVGCLVLSGCDQPQRPVAVPERPSEPRKFEVKGVIEELPEDHLSVVLNHERIPDFMPAMTMHFKVRAAKHLEGLQVGDQIRFQLNVGKEESWIDEIMLLQTKTRPPKPKLPPPGLTSSGSLKIGEVMPDCELRGEAGEPFMLSDFAGQAVALTFIFTRCPLPDFCPRMSQHFRQARDLLRQNPLAPTNWKLLSISFDAAFDQPDILTHYAQTYRGDDPAQWSFAVASPEVTASFGEWIDFRFADNAGSFSHNLRTVVLDPQRRLYRIFEGNKWTPEDLAEALSAAALRR